MQIIIVNHSPLICLKNHCYNIWEPCQFSSLHLPEDQGLRQLSCLSNLVISFCPEVVSSAINAIKCTILNVWHWLIVSSVLPKRLVTSHNSFLYRKATILRYIKLNWNTCRNCGCCFLKKEPTRVTWNRLWFFFLAF